MLAAFVIVACTVGVSLEQAVKSAMALTVVGETIVSVSELSYVNPVLQEGFGVAVIVKITDPLAISAAEGVYVAWVVCVALVKVPVPLVVQRTPLLLLEFASEVVKCIAGAN